MPTSTPRRFRLELGFDREAAPILGSAPAANFYPLQHALVDITDEQAPKPAWYTKLCGGDEVCIRVLDITDLVNGTGASPAAIDDATLQVINFDPKDSSRAVQVLDTPVEWQATAIAEGVPSPVYSTTDQVFAGYDVTPMTGAAFATLRAVPSNEVLLIAEFAMQVTLDSEPGKKYVFDPEMIVGPQSTGGGGGGGTPDEEGEGEGEISG